MLAVSLEQKQENVSSTANVAEVYLISTMRLVLAASVLITIFLDPSGLTEIDGSGWMLFLAYLLHSLALYVATWLGKPFAHGKWVHWADVGWYAAFVAITGGINSFLFLFFFFAILTSSFRWGFEEGARITLASTALFIAFVLLPGSTTSLPRLLLRTSFLLSMGYICVCWGESKLSLKRRLALLRDVTLFSNPRFGVDHTLTNVLDKTRDFFKAHSCVVVMRDRESGRCTLRTCKKDRTTLTQAQAISPDTAAQLMTTHAAHVLLHQRPGWLEPPGSGGCAYDAAADKWFKDTSLLTTGLAELLEASSFISAPLLLRKSEGRIYVVSNEAGLNKADALFLSQVVTQVFPMIENVELLDQIASEAATQERKKIALDLHDTTIQPYIGLKLALGALRKKAAPDNPLLDDLHKLVTMADEVIGDLRRYAGTFRQPTGLAGIEPGEPGGPASEPMFLVMLRQQAAQVREFYGVDIGISVTGDLQLSDRLMVEVLQLVREGLSNICKHTQAGRGEVRLSCRQGWLNIQIDNENPEGTLPDFKPRSISQRTEALGGRAQVRRLPGGNTAVCIAIPL